MVGGKEIAVDIQDGEIRHVYMVHIIDEDLSPDPNEKRRELVDITEFVIRVGALHSLEQICAL